MQKEKKQIFREKIIQKGIKEFQGRTFLSAEGIRYSFEDECAIKARFQPNGRLCTSYMPVRQSYRLIEAIMSGKLRQIVEEDKP